jgi:hypothetical protein
VEAHNWVLAVTRHAALPADLATRLQVPIGVIWGDPDLLEEADEAMQLRVDQLQREIKVADGKPAILWDQGATSGQARRGGGGTFARIDSACMSR